MIIMNKFLIVIFVLFSCFIIIPVYVFADLEPEEVSASYTTSSKFLYHLGGEYYSYTSSDFKPKEGDSLGLYRVFASVNFWNVGKEGNSLLDSKDYGEASLYVEALPDHSEPWQKYKKLKDDSDLFTFDYFDFKPRDYSFDLVFTGYANGVFKFHDKVVGRIDCSNGCYAVFDNWYLDFLFSPYNRDFDSPNVLYGRLKIPVPESAFQEHCPLKCDDNHHKLPVRATFDAIEGEVEVIPCGASDDDWSLARYDMILSSGDCIRTGEDSRVKISFDDMTSVVIGEETEVSLDYRYQKSVLQLIAGRIWENTKHALSGGSGLASVDMPMVAAGIKGTSFIAESTPLEDRVVVFNGSVELSVKKTGEVKLLGSGDKGVVSYNGSLRVGSFDPVDEKNSFYGSSSFPWFLFIIVFLLVFFVASFFVLKYRFNEE